MTESPETGSRPAPVLGWVSVGIAALVFALGVLAPTLVLAQAQAASSAGGGIGAVAGGVSGWLLLAVLALLVCSLGAAITGVVRGERPLWVHGLGVVLTIAAPVLAVAVLRMSLG